MDITNFLKTCSPEDIVMKIKSKPYWVKILANHLYDEGLISRTYKELRNLNEKKTSQFKKNGQFYKCQLSTWEDAQHQISKKRKLTLQWYTTTCYNCPRVGKDMEQLELSYTAGGNVNRTTILEEVWQFYQLNWHL